MGIPFVLAFVVILLVSLNSSEKPPTTNESDPEVTIEWPEDDPTWDGNPFNDE